MRYIDKERLFEMLNTILDNNPTNFTVQELLDQFQAQVEEEQLEDSIIQEWHNKEKE